jgi:hypothetical protein
MNFGKPISETALISRSSENQVGGSVYLPPPSSGSAEMKTGTRLAAGE